MVLHFRGVALSPESQTIDDEVSHAKSILEGGPGFILIGPVLQLVLVLVCVELPAGDRNQAVFVERPLLETAEAD